MYEILTNALTTLAERCDGARDDDGVGFNGRDTHFGKSLAQQVAAGRHLSEKQAFAAIKMLQTYRTQLQGYGIHLPTPLEYAGAAQNASKAPSGYNPTASAEKPRSGPEIGLSVAISAHLGRFCVRFPYNAALVEKIKTLPRRQFDKEIKAWLVPADCHTELRLLLQNYQTEWSTSALDLVSSVDTIRAASTRVDAEIEIPNLSGEPMPFQKAGVAFIDKCRGRALIGDEMGLGKTIQAISYLALHPELRPAVIVVPASLKTNWRREVEKWLTTDEVTTILSGTKPGDVPGSTIFIINYDILHAWVTWLSMLRPAVLICDEFHMCKTPKSRRTKAVSELAKASGRVIGLSGTPLMNKPAELYPLLKIVQPDQWSDWMSYAKRYCNARQVTMGGRKFWDFSGASNLRELNDKLRTVMIRRLKSEVLKELPEKRRVLVPVDIDLEAYVEFMETTLDELEAAGNQAAQLVILEKAKQYVVEAKMEQVFEWIDNFLDSGEKLILFCVHKATVAALQARYKHSVSITGESSQRDRDHAVQAFQNDPNTTLFIGNIQAAGVGLTLTAASNVAFVELAWRPGDQTQAEDRAHRIGQKNAVTAYYLLAEKTVEEETYKLLEKKRHITEIVTDGKVSDLAFDGSSVTQDLVSLLLANRKQQMPLQ